MHALAPFRLRLGFKGRTFNGQPVKPFDAWVANKAANQKAVGSGVMFRSDEYHRELMGHDLPLDNLALQALISLALPPNVYTWLAHCRTATSADQ